MPEYCMKCKKELSKCTCYVCPRCQVPLEDTQYKDVGLCPICNTEFELSEDVNGTSSLFVTFKKLFRDNIPIDAIKDNFKEEASQAGRRILIKSMGGTPNEDIRDDEPEKPLKEPEKDDEGEIEIEYSSAMETIKCPVCGTFVPLTGIKQHKCFQ